MSYGLIFTSRFDLVTNEISSFCNIPKEACARAFRVLIYQEYHYDKYRTMNQKYINKKFKHAWLYVNSDNKDVNRLLNTLFVHGRHKNMHVNVDLYNCIHKRKTTLIYVHCKYDCRSILYSYMFGMLGMARHTCSVMLFWSVLIISDHRKMYPLSAERTGWRKEYIVSVLLWRCRPSDQHKHTLYSVMMHRSKQ